jgi:uncharacterized membrane protein
MNKEEFLIELSSALAGLPEDDIEKVLGFYSEMIDDQIEDGLSEEEAVAAHGAIEEIRTQIIKDTPLQKLLKQKVKPKRSLRAWEITLIIVGSPLWFSLLVAAFAVVFSLYITLWSLIAVLFALETCFAACAFGGLVASIIQFIIGSTPSALFLLGCSITLAGLAILWTYVCKWSCKGLIWLTRVFFKSLFIRKDKNK